jgi:dCMP deaminase
MFKNQESLWETPIFGDGFTTDDWSRLIYDGYIVAQDSPDPSTQNGALLWNPAGDLIGVDCNRFPEGVEYTAERWERPLKYEVIEHAERNAIYWAAAAGRKTLGSTMVAPWAACSDCARAIIQAGVKRLVRHKQATIHGAGGSTGEKWDDSISTADMMLKEGGVEVIDIDWCFHERIGPVLEIRHAGELWHP